MSSKVYPLLEHAARVMGVRFQVAPEQWYLPSWCEPTLMGAYNFTTDHIVIHERGLEVHPEHGFNLVVAHEIIHATGHHKRLCRPGFTFEGWGNADIIFQEERIAQMGAGLLLTCLGLPNDASPSMVSDYVYKYSLSGMNPSEDSRFAKQAVGYVLTELERYGVFMKVA